MFPRKILANPQVKNAHFSLFTSYKHKVHCNARMGYSTDSRKKAMECLGRGLTMLQALDAFGIGLDTVNRWKQKLAKAVDLSYPPPRLLPDANLRSTMVAPLVAGCPQGPNAP